MFLSEKSNEIKNAGAVTPAVVTVSAADMSVYTDSEKSGITVIAPMGYMWRPEAGSDIFLIKTADGEDGAIGVAQNAEGLAPGDIMIKNGGGSICLRKSGGIVIKGNVTVSGSVYASGGVSGGGS